jgi:uncharacterized membrane protein
MLTNLIYAAATSPWTVNVQPNSKGLPGGNVWDTIAGGLQSWGLIAGVISIIAGAIVWTLGSHTHNPHVASRGRAGALIGAAGGLLTAAAPAIVEWGAHLGNTVH